MVAIAAMGLSALIGAGCAGRRSPAPGTIGTTTEAVRRDDQGRAYTVHSLPKSQAVRVDADHVRTTWGITLDLVGEDDASYRYKLYEVSPATPQPSRTPNGADRKRVAASYRSEVSRSDRLQYIPFGEGLPVQGQWRDGFDLADVDGDGKLDIVHGPPRAGQSMPSIFLGDGRGHWRLWRTASYPPLPYDYGDARAADLDGDGHVDLVLASHLRGFAALRGDGHGGFTDMGRGLELLKPGGNGPVPFSSRAFDLVDWNGDGRLDILALGEGPRLDLQRSGDRRKVAGAALGVALFLNQGKDGWRRADAGDPADGIFGQAIAVGDFNGDGRRDFVVASSILGRTDLVYLGTADGGWRRIPVPAIRPSAYVRAVAVADFDGDGRDDLAIGYLSFELDTWRSGIDVLMSRAGESFERRTLASSEDKVGVFALATGDLDGDHARDLVALNGDGETVIFLGNGHGSFTREKTAPGWAGKCRGVHAELRDLDGDGRDDLVAAFAEERSNATGSDERCPDGGGIAVWESSPR